MLHVQAEPFLNITMMPLWKYDHTETLNLLTIYYYYIVWTNTYVVICKLTWCGKSGNSMAKSTKIPSST